MPETTYVWFSGKGGTGKTTLSAATALQLADRGHETLLISTDPAHSVADALDMPIDGTTQVTDRLDAVQVDPEEEVAAYKETLQAAEGAEGVMQDVYEGLDIVQEGPGIAEMAALNRFMTFMQDDTYDVIVFDTAPTGHTLQLLQLPEVMESMAGKLLRMRLRFSQAIDTVSALFGKDRDVDEGVQQLEALKERVEAARRKLTDPSRTTFNLVLVPEAMAVHETRRAVQQLQDHGIPLGRLFINKCIPPNEDCSFCSARRTMQQEHIAAVRETFDLPVVTVPLFEQEVHGVDRLRALGDTLGSRREEDGDE